MGHVFISYSRQDTPIIERLVRELEAARVAVWIDREDILGGGARPTVGPPNARKERMILRDETGPEQGWPVVPSQAPRRPAAPEPEHRRRWAEASKPSLVNVIASIDTPLSLGVDLSAR